MDEARIRDYKREIGFELREPMQDDYGFVIHPEVEPRDLDDGDEPPDEDDWVRQTTGGDQPLAR